MATHRESSGQEQAKVAIPRLVRRRDPPKKPAATKQARVSRACLSCRARKIRCNGEMPTCQHCRDSSTRCEYASSRRDRLKIATDHNREMLQLLMELRASSNDSERTKIDNLVNRVNDDIADAASSLHRDSLYSQPLPENSGEASTSAEVGSNEDLDTMDEDLFRNEKSRATGYLGKQSTVQWLRRAHHEVEERGQDGNQMEGPYGPPGTSQEAKALRAEALRQRQSNDPNPLLQTSTCSFYLDDETVDMNFVVDPFDLPPLETAENLVNCFMETVQNTYPIIVRKIFLAQFHHHYTSLASGVPYQVPPKWQAMLNLVFAIAAAYSHLVRASWRGEDRDHILYHSRAWALFLKDPWWFSHPDLPQTQTACLLALYYLTIGHVNRAWVVIGMAVRFGVSLGLHVRNDDRTADTVKKENLSRIWWALYSLDRTLCSITGRPSVGAEAFCSVALPLPVSDEDIDVGKIQVLFGERPQDRRMSRHANPETGSASSSSQPHAQSQEPANSGSYLACTVRIGMIVQRILSDLYSPEIVSLSWKEVQDRILGLREDLATWAAQIPQALHFENRNSSGDAMRTERDILHIYYHSATILVTRPCLCRIDRRIKHQTQISNDLNMRMASDCIDSAKAMASLLPDKMGGGGEYIYEVFPWWAAVHYIMQALAVLLLEISYEMAPEKGQDDTVSVIKTLIRWLRAMKRNNGIARRAYGIALELLSKMVDLIKIDISDFLGESNSEDEEPDFGYSKMSNVFSPTLNTQPDFSGQYGPHTLDPSFDFMWQHEGLEADPLHPQFLHNSLQSHPSFANLFRTGFDQTNPFSLGGQRGDMTMTETLHENATGQGSDSWDRTNREIDLEEREANFIEPYFSEYAGTEGGDGGG